MNHLYVARRLLQPSRDLLLDHIDGSCVVPLQLSGDECWRRQVRNAMQARGFLHRREVANPTSLYTARTYLTEDGRNVLSALLGMYADALMRAGFTGLESPQSPAPSLEDSAPPLLPVATLQTDRFPAVAPAMPRKMADSIAVTDNISNT